VSRARNDRTDEAVAAALALWAASPYLPDPQATIDAFWQGNPLGTRAARTLPRSRRHLGGQDDWRPVTRVAGLSRSWSQPRRDLIGTELALAFPTLIDHEPPDHPGYARRVDVGLEALRASITYTELQQQAQATADLLVTESQTTLQKIADSEAVDLLAGEAINLAQGFVTGIRLPGWPLRAASRKGRTWAINAWRKPLESQAMDLAQALLRIHKCRDGQQYTRVNELRYQIDLEQQYQLTAIASGQTVTRSRHRYRMVELASTRAKHLAEQHTSENAPAMAPDLRQLPLRDAKASAKAAQIRTTTVDALRTDDFPGRLVLRPGAWRTIDQWPPPGYYLTPAQRVRLYVVKDHAAD